MKKIKIYSALFVVCVWFLAACQSKQNEVTIDTDMVKFLFPNQKNVLTGGDGAISICIDKDKSYWIWGDSFIGEVKNNTRDTNSPLIVGNIWQLADGANIRTIHRGTPQQPLSILDIDSVDGYYAFLWPMHGFVKNGIVHVFMSVIVRNGDAIFDFYWHSSRYYRLKYPNLELIDEQEMEQARQSNVHYGFGFFEQDGYYYTYGTKPEYLSATLHVARTQLINDKLQNWEFFDGTAWSSDPLKTKELQGIDIPVSEQFSVFPHQDKFILVAQDRFVPNIYTYIADNPQGQWYNKKWIYNEPEAKDTTLFLYNAMAHPQYDVDGKLLIGYSVNTKNIPDLYTDVSIYKPRFIRVPYTLILQ